jgi:hypothetical protein
MGHYGPLENPLKCPIMCFAPDKKIIFCTFRIRGTLVFLCPKEKERKRGRERDRDSERESGRGSKGGRERER